MAPSSTQQSKVGKFLNPFRCSPNSHKYAEVRVREYLLPREVESVRDGENRRFVQPGAMPVCCHKSQPFLGQN
ncbi:hypothetical protein NDI44_25860 [Trichocoleus sp. DQ-A3]|uniref:hypothetical protein n=1 Tax=Cyanophyceae TaxID=3028117 RepID=UPI001684DD67|nr:hypothetical protein [Coleofasciculus sp. FACHB-125]MBD1903454.1 hypothetical protein [Coleofasciculus sp. FACHB-125]